jgi:hypothetical protein
VFSRDRSRLAIAIEQNVLLRWLKPRDPSTSRPGFAGRHTLP